MFFSYSQLAKWLRSLTVVDRQLVKSLRYGEEVAENGGVRSREQMKKMLDDQHAIDLQLVGMAEVRVMHPGAEKGWRYMKLKDIMSAEYESE
ncbi:hypothetical protein CLAFUW4_12359 [Fulvia fulva]|uniref:Uncharacterized protein n=1 Tax=Passalora fulva TaxID=5499 RepID=A0A9Q8USL3_PASFU|nr:uncharacterized protein CLAFUR5_11388 [Fulvia fulva]KAK4618136.1 hypothetical protein CLAFUR4_12364 [Fulvia fulva]KAK4618805.1 hypothetical protein CLAFUR0_12375 [Fulvia fulva]UJO20949.1 hypothetical protein CLAFUR5_11388 [Fulvia fulva]WPV18621.1 hypothetical protein CLAFUW4_12359 [Fulvia fulva]WPV33590.1 hypothetical protein CLAFUW7_12366 [Fulvia fulva]